MRELTQDLRTELLWGRLVAAETDLVVLESFNKESSRIYAPRSIPTPEEVLRVQSFISRPATPDPVPGCTRERLRVVCPSRPKGCLVFGSRVKESRTSGGLTPDVTTKL